jgi:uncharacterized protein
MVAAAVVGGLSVLVGCSSSGSATEATSTPSGSADGSRPTQAGTASPAEDTVVVRVGDAEPVRAEVADTPAERQRGLMGRTDVPAGTGMVFVFPGETRSSFYMYRTLVPLSIAFVNADEVVSVEEMTPCPSDTSGDCPLYEPAGTYTYAVEATAGWFAEAGVEPGDPVTVDGQLPTGS